MPNPDPELLVVGISSTALFDLAEADALFDDRGIRDYREYMLEREDELLAPGTGMPLVRALLGLRRADPDDERPLVEVVLMSQNSPETGTRLINTVHELGLPISRFAFTGGEPLAGYIDGYHIDLFLSRNPRDVQRVIDSGKCAAAVLRDPPDDFEPVEDQVRIAFDADAVLFSDESEALFKREGLETFLDSEAAAQEVPMADGPFARFLRKLATVKRATEPDEEYSPVRLAVVTARNAPAEKRVIVTLRSWGVYVDAAYFLGGWDKTSVLRAVRPHIFFDDQDHHVLSAARVVPSGKVPYTSDSPLAPADSTPLSGAGNAIPVRRAAADREGA